MIKVVQDSTFHRSAHPYFVFSCCNDKNSQILPSRISSCPELCLFPFHRVHCGEKFCPRMYFSPAKFQSLRAYPRKINCKNVDLRCGLLAISIIKSPINSRNPLERTLFCCILMAAMLLVPTLLRSSSKMQNMPPNKAFLSIFVRPYLPRNQSQGEVTHSLGNGTSLTHNQASSIN